MHFHILKTETWYVIDGVFSLRLIIPETAEREVVPFLVGETLTIRPGHPHQLIAGPEGGKIAEASTQHFDSDSYRVEPGDSQGKE